MRVIVTFALLTAMSCASAPEPTPTPGVEQRLESMNEPKNESKNEPNVEDLDALGKKIEKAHANREWVETYLHLPSVFRKAFPDATPYQVGQMAIGFRKGLAKTQKMSPFHEVRFKYIRPVTIGEKKWILIRIWNLAGTHYIAMEPVVVETHHKVQDVFYLALGRSLFQEITKIPADVMESFKTWANTRFETAHSAKAAFQKLGPDVTQRKLFRFQYTLRLQEFDDTTLFEEEFERYEADYGDDPSVVSLQLARNLDGLEAEPALVLIDQLQKAIGGPDTHIDLLRATALFVEDRKRAVEIIDRALSKEPDFLDAIMMKLVVLELESDYLAMAPLVQRAVELHPEIDRTYLEDFDLTGFLASEHSDQIFGPRYETFTE